MTTCDKDGEGSKNHEINNKLILSNIHTTKIAMDLLCAGKAKPEKTNKCRNSIFELRNLRPMVDRREGCGGDRKGQGCTAILIER